jgi:hypothetical protein
MSNAGLRLWLNAVLISALATGGACAVKQKAGAATFSCSVVGGEKIPAAAGGRDTLCGEVRQSLAGIEGAADATVVIHVRRSHLSANVELADGRALPEIGFAVSDAPLSSDSVKRFAARIAAVVADGTVK